MICGREMFSTRSTRRPYAHTFCPVLSPQMAVPRCRPHRSTELTATASRCLGILDAGPLGRAVPNQCPRGASLAATRPPPISASGLKAVDMSPVQFLGPWAALNHSDFSPWPSTAVVVQNPIANVMVMHTWHLALFRLAHPLSQCTIGSRWLQRRGCLLCQCMPPGSCPRRHRCGRWSSTRGILQHPTASHLPSGWRWTKHNTSTELRKLGDIMYVLKESSR